MKFTLVDTLLNYYSSNNNNNNSNNNNNNNANKNTLFKIVLVPRYIRYQPQKLINLHI